MLPIQCLCRMDKTIIKEAYSIINFLANTFAAKTSVSADTFTSVMNSKLPLVLSKIDNTRNPKAFIKKSLRGYVLNYLRDGSRLIKIPREISYKSQKMNKYPGIYGTYKPEYNPDMSDLEMANIKKHVKDSSYGKELNRYTMYDTESLEDYSYLKNFLSEREIELLNKIFIEKTSEKSLSSEENKLATYALKKVYETYYQ